MCGGYATVRGLHCHSGAVPSPETLSSSSSSRFKVLKCEYFFIMYQEKKPKLNSTMIFICTWLIFVLVGAKTCLST